MTARRGRRTALRAALTAVLIAAAAALWHNLPTYAEVNGPFDVNGVVGEQVRGRAIAVTVSGVRIGARVQRPSGPPVPAVGEWIVVDADLLATTDFVKPWAQLRVGPNTYIPSDRFVVTPLGAELAPGIEQRGSWVFDVAPELLDGSVPAELRVWEGDGRLDSRLVVTIPFGADTRRDDPVMLEPVQVGG